MLPEERWRVRVEDILEAVSRAREYTAGMSAEEFLGDRRTIDAVVRNIEVIGEAARHIPEEVQARAPDVPWFQIRGMRNVVIHEYETVDAEIVGETVREDLPSVVEPLRRLLKSPDRD